ncbi:membrane protein YdbS with pleckstrin-like domain [Jatrophihabitans sp. GAS493]|uniref:PH domain-containing protein n=1 Tax=Jatrophihabitans sp. GAS493 TaxID=1907575 RepID=UPI000BB985DD|nr:PH domain-containing protein [Jatrophihabitans sp. GAS493]SOD73161.1 membrane protein YdbS with pleckstrin-like domain [Jatrophihabitans sp. GAS493]
MADVVERYLLPTEGIVFEVRRHWVSLAESGVLYLAFLIGGFLALGFFEDVEILRLMSASFLILSTAWYAWIVFDWHIERLVVTKKRVILISGILTRNVAIMPLTKVTDLTYQQSLLGRLFDYGTFIIESAGQDQALSRIDYISGPDKHYQQISNLLFGTGAATDPEDAPLPSSSPSSSPTPSTDTDQVPDLMLDVGPSAPGMDGDYFDEPAAFDDPDSHNTSPLPRINVGTQPPSRRADPPP